MLDIMSNPVVWYVFVGIVILCIVGILIESFPAFRWVAFTVLVVVLLGTAIYSSVQLNTYYNAEGGIYGKIEQFLDKNEAEEVGYLKYSVDNFSLSPTLNDDEYSATIFINDILKIEDEKDYGLYLNGVPCSNIKFSKDHITAEFAYAFYDYESEVIRSDTLFLNISMYDNYTNLIVRTNGGLSAVKCWHSFVEKENFVIEIKPFDYVERV